MNAKPLSRLLTLTASTLVCAALFYCLFPYYAKAVLLLSSSVLELFSAHDITLRNIPATGFVLTYAQDRQPLLFKFDLVALLLNLIFVPTLVITTIGPTPRGARSALMAIAPMMGLHVFHIVVLVLHFLSRTPNPVIQDLYPHTRQLKP